MSASLSLDPSISPLVSIERGGAVRIPFEIHLTAVSCSKVVANTIASLICKRAADGKPCVLGLATGSTPVMVYAELVRMHREEGLSFSNVITFNLDEYFPMQPDCLQSYVRFMHENLFNHIDILPHQINIPDGTIAPEQVEAYCRRYEQQIVDAGGIDIQLLGIGRTGHVGFNEPGSGIESRTRMIILDGMTRIDAASAFLGIENVPRSALTMGVATILQARQILLLAFGEGKAKIVARAIEGEMSTSVPATFLQAHPNTTFLLDSAAAALLAVTKAP